MSRLLRFDGVALDRGGRLLFEGVSFELNAGDALALVGPNGSGKSSLLRLAAGLLRTSAGKVERCDLALSDHLVALDRDRRLGDALRFWMGRDPGAALDQLGLASLADVPVRFLSSGQLKRASLARVAASAAPLWLLDEPTNALDADGERLLADLIAKHRAKGGAVVAATHVPMAGEWRRMDLGQ